MPFVVRTVQPKFLSRDNKLLDTAGSPLVKEGELDAVINNTLCNCLKQLGSVVSVAGDIFKQLNEELVAVSEKTDALKARMARLNAHTEEFDPKLVTVRSASMQARLRRSRKKCAETYAHKHINVLPARELCAGHFK
ncbi:hypothetical protein M8J77_023204 [Diaphorina citri]|nr:hypothetical protein M8J77_023204 [Diaphorina citri]